MDNILIISHEEAFLVKHLSFWLKEKKLDFIITNDVSRYKNHKFDIVLFMEEMRLSVESKNLPINKAVFDFSFGLLKESLLINTRCFIYIDTSYQTDFINPTHSMYNKIGRDMVYGICKLLNKQYKIIYLYDLIGYKFTNFSFSETNIQRIMEMNFPSIPKSLVYHFHYYNKHYVYIADAMRSIVKIIEFVLTKKDKVEQIEEHIRYDDKGFDVTKIISLFEDNNNIKLLNTSITYGDQPAPLSGSPSWFLKDFKTNKKFWLQVRKTIDY